MTDHASESSPRIKARVAGVLYLLAVFTAVLGETLGRGSLAIALGFFAVACFVGVTLLFYAILKPVSKSVALLMALLGLIGLSFEALRWEPLGVNLGVVFHGLYCLVVGFLVFRSSFLPRFLGVLMAIAGLAWLTNVSPSLARHLSPYNVGTGFAGEGLLMLWLLIMALNAQRWQERSSASN